MRSRSGWTGRSSLYSLIVRQTLALQVLVIVLGLALPLLAVVPLNLQQRMIDTAIPQADRVMMATLAAEYGAVLLMSGVLKFLVTYLRGWIEEIVSRIVRVAIVEAQRHRSQADAGRKLGTVTSMITGEVEDLGGFAAEALNTPIIEGGSLLSVVGFVAISEPRLAVVGVSALLLQALLTPLIQNRVNRLTRKRIMALRRAGLDLIEAVEPAAHARIVPALLEIRHTYRLRLRMNALKAALKVINNLIMNLATIAILAFGGVMVIRGEMSLGLIVAFLSGLRQIDEHWGELLDFYRRYTDARVKYRLVATALEIDGLPDPGLAVTAGA